MFFIVLIFLAVQPRPLIGTEDYWDDNFDENKNCEAEEEIKKLSRLPQPKRCAVAKHGNNFTNYHQDNAYFQISLLPIIQLNRIAHYDLASDQCYDY